MPPRQDVVAGGIRGVRERRRRQLDADRGAGASYRTPAGPVIRQNVRKQSVCHRHGARAGPAGSGRGSRSRTSRRHNRARRAFRPVRGRRRAGHVHDEERLCVPIPFGTERSRAEHRLRCRDTEQQRNYSDAHRPAAPVSEVTAPRDRARRGSVPRRRLAKPGRRRVAAAQDAAKIAVSGVRNVRSISNRCRPGPLQQCGHRSRPRVVGRSRGASWKKSRSTISRLNFASAFVGSALMAFGEQSIAGTGTVFDRSPGRPRRARLIATTPRRFAATRSAARVCLRAVWRRCALAPRLAGAPPARA